MPKRLSYDYVLSEFNKCGYTLISGEYHNAHEKLQYICNKHKDMGIQNITYADLYSSHRCKYCAKESEKCSKRLNFDNVKQKFIEYGYELLTKEYLNNHQDLYYICKKHRNKGVQHIKFNNLHSGCGCYYCGRERTIKAVSKTNDQFLKEFNSVQNNKFILLSDYTKKNAPILLRCNTCGCEFKRQPCVLLRGGIECPMCDKHIGENHPNWKGGISNLEHDLRSIISEWKISSMKHCMYKCVLSGDKFDVIHHLYGFNMIVDEFANKENINVKNYISVYSLKERQNIESKFIEFHSQFPLGVCLTKEIHSLFHQLYGYGDNTIGQFEEFKQRYKSGEFAEDLAS